MRLLILEDKLVAAMKPFQPFWIAGLIAVLSLTPACGKQPRVSADQSASAESTQRLPFDRELPETGISPSQSLVPAPTRLPAGTPITIRLATAISSSSSHTGDSFEATLDEPIMIEGQTVVARGAALTGRVLAAKPSGRLHDPGYLRIALVSLSVNGKPVAIESSSVFAKGGSHEKRNLAMIGGGTAAGALIGGLAGGGKGALIGSTVGAAGGTGTAYATGKKEVAFDAERRLTFRLSQATDLH